MREASATVKCRLAHTKSFEHSSSTKYHFDGEYRETTTTTTYDQFKPFKVGVCAKCVNLRWLVSNYESLLGALMFFAICVLVVALSTSIGWKVAGVVFGIANIGALGGLYVNRKNIMKEFSGGSLNDYSDFGSDVAKYAYGKSPDLRVVGWTALSDHDYKHLM